MGNKFLLFLSVILCSFFLSSCHTHTFQGVENQIQDTWYMMPKDDGNVVKWTFENGSLSITINDQQIEFETAAGAKVTSTTYTVENKLANHYMYIKSLKVLNGPQSLLPEVNKWLVIKSNKTEFFIESIKDSGHKGEYQYHFFK